MGRLTREQRLEAIEDIKRGMEFEEFRDKYHVTRDTFKSYGGKSKYKIDLVKEANPIKQVEEKTEPETQEDLKEEVNHMPENKEEKEKPKEEEQKPEAIPIPQEPETEPDEQPQQEDIKVLDSNKDYCGVCYENGRVTEVSKDKAFCPICGVALEWQQ